MYKTFIPACKLFTLSSILTRTADWPQSTEANSSSEFTSILCAYYTVCQRSSEPIDIVNCYMGNYFLDIQYVTCGLTSVKEKYTYINYIKYI